MLSPHKAIKTTNAAVTCSPRTIAASAAMKKIQSVRVIVIMVMVVMIAAGRGVTAMLVALLAAEVCGLVVTWLLAKLHLTWLLESMLESRMLVRAVRTASENGEFGFSR